MGVLRAKSWSPYLVGALIGMLCWVAFLTAGKALGVSTTFVRATNAVATKALPIRATQNAYFMKYEAKVDWQMMLVVGIFVGALLSAVLSGDAKVEAVPELWKKRFGRSVLVRWFWAFIGGMLVLFGARLAGGCATGHGLSGGLQLALSSWVVFGSLLVSGMATALLVFGRGEH